MNRMLPAGERSAADLCTLRPLSASTCPGASCWPLSCNQKAEGTSLLQLQALQDVR